MSLVGNPRKLLQNGMRWSYVKACRLPGVQNIETYDNWKGDEKQIREEYEKNKALGEKKGLWKYACLTNHMEIYASRRRE